MPASRPRRSTPSTTDGSRPRHQRVLNPRSDSTAADARWTVAVYSVFALLAVFDVTLTRTGNALLLPAVVLIYSFLRAAQGWFRLVSLRAAAA